MVKITKMKDLDRSSVDTAQTAFSFANFVPVERFSYLSFPLSSFACPLNSDLDVQIGRASCNSFEITSGWYSETVVILCFDEYRSQSCYSFDGTIKYIGDSNYFHHNGGLTKYKRNLITVGGCCMSTGDTELMERTKNGTFIWSVVESDRFQMVQEHSLVTIPPSDMTEEYVLLIGGYVTLSNDVVDDFSSMPDSNFVYKFNGTWSDFGKLNKPRSGHNSIYWNGAVYIIGGGYGSNGIDNSVSYQNLTYSFEDEYAESLKTKIEIWKIGDSPDEFKISENWPELNNWNTPHLFIVPDSFFPDY